MLGIRKRIREIAKLKSEVEDLNIEVSLLVYENIQVTSKLIMAEAALEYIAELAPGSTASADLAIRRAVGYLDHE